jgi:16S rRNA (uracil1498-N3)-methyltransferase
MADRFFLPGDWGDIVELTGPEAHHLVRVLRAHPGDEIELFDGQGRSAQARVESIDKQAVTVRIETASACAPSPEPTICLAAASPKGERLRWMIEKVTELGVDRFVPLSTTRGVVEPSDHKLSKLEQTSIAACKQCGRNRLLQIEESRSLAELLDRVPGPSPCLLVGSTDGIPIATLNWKKACVAGLVVAVVGPEGGLTPEEKNLLARRGAEFVSVSPFSLRVETAAVALMAWLCGQRAANSSRISSDENLSSA